MAPTSPSLSSMAYVHVDAIDEPHGHPGTRSSRITRACCCCRAASTVRSTCCFARRDRKKPAPRSRRWLPLFKIASILNYSAMTGGPNGGVKGSVAEAGLVDFAYAHDVALVATNDVYFASGDLYYAHEALLCISDSTFMGVEDRRRVTEGSLSSGLPLRCATCSPICAGRSCGQYAGNRPPLFVPGQQARSDFAALLDTGAGADRRSDQPIPQARRG